MHCWCTTLQGESHLLGERETVSSVSSVLTIFLIQSIESSKNAKEELRLLIFLYTYKFPPFPMHLELLWHFEMGL